MKTIVIAKEFSDVPAGRYYEDGDFSGQRFREKVLVPALNENDRVQIVLDGAEGYGSSFLEEGFGGLIRKHGYTESDLNKKIEISYSSPEFRIYKELIEKYIHEAELRRRSVAA